MALVFQSLPNTYSITNSPINYVHGVYASGGTIYAATQNQALVGGLSISTDGGASFTNYTTANGLESNTVNAVYAADGTIYAGTNYGLTVAAPLPLLSVSASTSQGSQLPAVTVVSTDSVVTERARAQLSDQQVNLGSQAIDFGLEIGDESPSATANIPLNPPLADLTLTTGDGKRDPSIAPIYYAIDAQGALSPLSYDPLLNAGARFYDTDGDGFADFISLKLIDGGFGDKDGSKNGVIDDPSAMGTVALDPVITALENGFLQVADAANAAPAAIALEAFLTSRANAVKEIGYVILNEGEEASTVSDITSFQERASLLFSALENNDVTLNEAMTFNSQFLLRNGQSIRFYAVTNGSLADLTSLEDSRFSFLDGDVDATTGAASFSSASGIGFDLELLISDQTLGAPIAQEQQAAPLLDFTAFTNDETITGTIVQAREAEYDAVTGFYRVLDTSGSVRAADGSLLTPGDDGYAAAALLEANRISAFDNLSIADGESPSNEFSLKEAFTIAPFAKVKGNTFFAFADANPDGLSHLPPRQQPLWPGRPARWR